MIVYVVVISDENGPVTDKYSTIVDALDAARAALDNVNTLTVTVSAHVAV